MTESKLQSGGNESQPVVIVGAAAMPEDVANWLRLNRDARPAGSSSDPFAIWVAKPSKGDRAQWDRVSSETGIDPITAISKAAFVGAGDQVQPALILWSYLAKLPIPDPSNCAASMMHDAASDDPECPDGKLYTAAVNWIQSRYAEMLQTFLEAEVQRVNSGIRFAESVRAVRQTIANHEARVGEIVAEANRLHAEKMRPTELP